MKPNQIRDAQKMADTDLKVIPVVNNLIEFLLSLERILISRHQRIAFVTSLLAVAYKDII